MQHMYIQQNKVLAPPPLTTARPSELKIFQILSRKDTEPNGSPQQIFRPSVLPKWSTSLTREEKVIVIK